MASDGLDLAFDNDPSSALFNRQQSIQQLVAHLSDSAQRVQDRIGVQDVPAVEQPLEQQPEPMPDGAPTQESRPTVNPDKFGLHKSFGAAMTAAVSQAMSAGRFDAVRDSLTGDQVDSLMHLPQRPLAEPKNVLTVRTMPSHTEYELQDVVFWNLSWYDQHQHGCCC